MTRLRGGETPLALSCTVSSQPAFAAAAAALTVRVGEQAGCAADDAARLGRAVREALDGAILAADASRPQAFDLTFHGTSRVVRVDVAVAPAVNGRQPAFSFEETLNGHGRTPTIEGLVDRVEFGQENGRSFCRLTHRIRAPQ